MFTKQDCCPLILCSWAVGVYWGGQSPAGNSDTVPGEGKRPKGSREKVWLPLESTQHLFPHGRQAGKCFEQVQRREERAGRIFPSFSLRCLPFSLCRAGLWVPRPLPLASHCVFVFLLSFLHAPSSPSGFLTHLTSVQPPHPCPRIGTTHPWAQDLCQLQGPASQTFSSLCQANQGRVA